MESNRQIKIICASDRVNYGDLLFPIILEKLLLNKKNSFENYGIKSSDLSSFGALKTQSIFKLIFKLKFYKKKTLLIIAGGEVLGSKWENILSYIHNFWERLFNISLLRKLNKKFKITELFSNFFLFSKHPFIFNRLDSGSNKNIEICYNSVGGLGVGKILEDKLIFDYFKSVKVLSVRDYKTKEIFDKNKIKCKLVPDSAIIMSDLFSSELNRIKLLKNLDIRENNYIFLQLGNYKGPNDLNKFVNSLSKYSNINNLKILLSPIGLAPKHEDGIILKKIQSYNEKFLYYEPQNVYETMYLIKNAKIYIGSSLHGVITAQSFGIRFLALTEKVKKTQYYIDTWIKNPLSYYVENFDLFENKLNSVDLFKNEEFENNLTIQKNMVYNNIESFFK